MLKHVNIPPQIMGIVNVTPNSFSDTGAHLAPKAAAAHAKQLVKDGAAILDLGAEASSFFRAGVEPVSPAEQIARLLPVVELVRSRERRPPMTISIDTRSAEVARAAIKNGARMINDISAGEHDPAMFATAAELGVPIILMHISPNFPSTPERDEPAIVEKVSAYLAARARAAMTSGISRHNILLDMGLGFGKTMADNWRLLAGVLEFKKLAYPLVLGLSRKRFLETPPPAELGEFARFMQYYQPSEPKPEHLRDAPTEAITAAMAEHVSIHRVHNVRLAAKALSPGKPRIQLPA